MKTVLLLRHAKSDWGNPALADFDRPLAKRGRQDAPVIGNVLADFDHVPDKIISSPAKRAKETATLVAKACGYTKAIEWEAAFYGGGSPELISSLQRLPASVERVMLVGHNPTMEETVSDLLSPPNSSWDERYAIRMPTAALVCLEVEIMDWAELAPGDAVLRWFVIPKLIQAIT